MSKLIHWILESKLPMCEPSLKVSSLSKATAEIKVYNSTKMSLFGTMSKIQNLSAQVLTYRHGEVCYLPQNRIFRSKALILNNSGLKGRKESLDMATWTNQQLGLMLLAFCLVQAVMEATLALLLTMALRL